MVIGALTSSQHDGKLSGLWRAGVFPGVESSGVPRQTLNRPESAQGMITYDQPRVLLVDDNASVLEHAAATLSSACVVVGAVKDGKAALESVNRLHPDVIVLDISMPGMSGLEVASRLRRAGSTIPIVFLTIHDDEELVRATQAAGGIGYVVKTLLSSDLLVAVNSACAGKRYVSQLR